MTQLEANDNIYRSLQELNTEFMNANVIKRKSARPKMDELVRIMGTLKVVRKSRKSKSVLSPLLAMMGFVGIVDRRRDANERLPVNCSLKLCCFRNYVTLIIMYLYLIHYACITIVYGKLHSSARVLSGHISVILRIFVITVNVTIFASQQEKLYKLTDQISRVIRSFNQKEIRSIKTRCLLTVVFLASCMISLMISGVISDFEDLDSYAFNFFYGLNKTMENSTVMAICVVDWSVFVLVDFMGSLIVTYFGFVCFLLRLKVGVMCSTMNIMAQQRNICGNEVGKLVQNYSELLMLSKTTDSLFNRIVFLWYSDVLNRFIYFLPIIVMSVLNPGEYTITAAVLNLFTNVVVFITVSITASGIGDDMDDGISQLGSIAAKATIVNEPVYQKTVGFVAITNALKLSLTGCNCFNLQKSIILTTFSVVISYIVVIVSVFPIFEK